MSASAKFYFFAGENELIETNVHLSPDCRSAIHGYVKDCSDKPVQDAAVLLFEVIKPEEEMRLFARGFTDEDGEFVFGPLICGQTYLIKVYKNTEKIRELLIVPDPCDYPCERRETETSTGMTDMA